MAKIDVGPAAIDRASLLGGGETHIFKDNPANKSGILTTIELWLNAVYVPAGWKVGSFYGSGTTYTSRDYATLPNVSVGYNKFTGLSIEVVAGDLIGMYMADGAGFKEADTSGGLGLYAKVGDQFGTGVQTYQYTAGYIGSLYGEGSAPPEVATLAATEIMEQSAMGNGNIENDGGLSVTQHGVLWKKGADPVNLAGADAYTQEGAGSEGAFTSKIGKPPVDNWMTRSSAEDNDWYSVCWSPALELFCAVAYTGESNRVMTSPDGINWTIRSSAADNGWWSVCWSPALELFCAVANSGTGNRVMTSPDGINWTIRSSAADNDWRSVCWSPALELFCAVANSGTGNRVMTSPDGINWTIRSSAADNGWCLVCWSPALELFCAVANSGTGNRVMTSPDGINWTIRSSAADNDWRSVCWSPALELFCAVAYTGEGNRVMTSPDGINWTIRSSAADNGWYSVCWSPALELFCAVASTGTGNRVMTSPDGINWTIRSSAANNNYSLVCWSPALGLFCAVARTGTGNRVMTSLVSPTEDTLYYYRAYAVNAEGTGYGAAQTFKTEFRARGIII